MNLTPFLEAIAASGLVPPSYLEITTTIKPNRWAGNPDKPREPDSWYYFDGESLTWGDWVLGGKIGSFRTGDDPNQTPEQVQATLEARRQRQLIRDREQAERDATGAAKAQQIYSSAPDCTQHGYLERKGIPAPKGLKLASDGRLIVPVYGSDDELISVQYIAVDGGKRFLARASVNGGWFRVGEAADPAVVAVAEGMATAASIHAATGWPCYVGFSCGGLKAAAETAKRHYPKAQIIVCGDKGNGSQHAHDAAIAVGGVSAIPQLTQGTDFNDLHASEGLAAVRQQLEAALLQGQLPTSVRKLAVRWALAGDSYCNERYLSALPDVPFLALKSAKGTGKTETISLLIDPASGERTTVITHRRSLGRALCQRFDLPFGERHSDLAYLTGSGLCIDSLVRLPRSQWGETVIIDEVEQVVAHLLEASTEVKKHRAETIKLLAELLQQAKRIIIADADLSPVALNFIEKLSGRKFHVHINEYRSPETAYPITHHEQRRCWLEGLKRAVLDGQKLLILTDSQKTSSKYGTQALEGWLLDLKPDLRILRGDAESLADPSHPAYGCVENLNEIAKDYDVVILSPSLETGFSLDLRGHFDAVWGIFAGVLPENSVRQFLARLREAVPRHICLPKRGLCSGYGGHTEPSQVLKSHNREAQALRHLYQDAFTEIDESGAVQVDADTLNAALTAWASIRARVNLGAATYRENVLGMLQLEEHRISDAACGNDEAAKETEQELKECSDILYAVECQEIADSPDLDKAERERIEAAKTRSRKERAALRKAQLAQRYLVGVCPELVALDDAGIYGKLRLLFFATVGRESLAPRDRRIIKKAAEAGAFAPDIHKATYGQKIALLDALGVADLLADSDREYRPTDADVVKLQTSAIAHREDIKALLGIWVRSDSKPMQTLSLILGQLGIKLKALRREGSRGHQKRVYGAVFDELKNSILEAWAARELIGSQCFV